MLPKALRILLVEDDEPKLRAVKEFLESTFSPASLVLARSYSSAMSELDKAEFDLAVLDMSLPTYDLAKDAEGGGDPQGYGGQDLMRTLEGDFPNVRAVVITQYNLFPDPMKANSKTFAELQRELEDEFGALFLGMVSYSGKLGRWKADVRTIIEENFQDENPSH